MANKCLFLNCLQPDPSSWALFNKRPRNKQFCSIIPHQKWCFCKAYIWKTKYIVGNVLAARGPYIYKFPKVLYRRCPWKGIHLKWYHEKRRREQYSLFVVFGGFLQEKKSCKFILKNLNLKENLGNIFQHPCFVVGRNGFFAAWGRKALENYLRMIMVTILSSWCFLHSCFLGPGLLFNKRSATVCGQWL